MNQRNAPITSWITSYLELETPSGADIKPEQCQKKAAFQFSPKLMSSLVVFQSCFPAYYTQEYFSKYTENHIAAILCNVLCMNIPQPSLHELLNNL